MLVSYRNFGEIYRFNLQG